MRRCRKEEQMLNRKRLLLMLAAVLVLLCSIALAETGGPCGKGITWTFTDGTVRVEGKGAMQDGAFWEGSVPADEIRQAIIGDGITRIGEKAFCGCGKLKQVTLPDSLTAIGESAFEGCKSLKTLRLPTEITEIGFQTFDDSLKRLEIPVLRSTTGITLGSYDKPFYLPGQQEAYIFAHTETSEYIGLTLYEPQSKDAETVEFPDGLECIREGFFSGMEKLKSIRIPDSMTKFSMHSFAGIYRECVILCGKGSAAEKFCLEKGFQFDNGERRVVGYDIQNEKEKVRWIVRNYIRAGMSERQKAQVLHNWLITNAHYHEDGTMKSHDGKTLLLEGYGVCEAYAEAYGKFLTEAGIAWANMLIQKMSHAWNLVRVDGRWYHVDATWDDGPACQMKRYPCVSGMEKNQYFLLTDKQIRADHDWEDRYVSADKGRPLSYYEPRLGREIWLQVWIGTNGYLLDWDHQTATVLGPCYGTETEILIPAEIEYEEKQWKVTAVDDGAFRKNKKIKSVTIGKNIRKIGANAFRDSGLTKITLKTDRLTEENVGKEAFGGLSEKVRVRCSAKQLKRYKKLLRKRGVSKKAEFIAKE